MSKYIIGIDQSTQGTKALLVDEGGHLIHRADRSHRQIVNEAGWVSHDPAEIAANVLAVARAVVEETGVDPADIAGIGISNQRETTVAWNRTTDEPLCDAVVWQCARARELCDELAAREGVAELVRGEVLPAAEAGQAVVRDAAAPHDLAHGRLVVRVLHGGGAVAEDDAQQRLGQLDIPFVGLENLARIPAQVAQFEKRDHTRKKQQADDAQKTDRHPFAQTRHSVLNFHSCKYSD